MLMKNKISSLVSEANLDTKINFLGATITIFFGAVKVHDALKAGAKKWIKQRSTFLKA